MRIDPYYLDVGVNYYISYKRCKLTVKRYLKKAADYAVHIEDIDGKYVVIRNKNFISMVFDRISKATYPPYNYEYKATFQNYLFNNKEKKEKKCQKMNRRRKEK